METQNHTHSRRSLAVSFTTRSMVFAALCAASVSTHAEVGDYTPWQSFLNRSNPPAADKPITPADQSNVPIEIKSASSEFNDGFMPALYDTWQKVTLDPATGAKCADGSPYQFFVKRRSSSRNVMVTLEGGGACWDYKGCSSSVVGASIKNIFTPDNKKDVLSFLSPTAVKYDGFLSTVMRDFLSVFQSDFNPHYQNRSQKWTNVYLPYCTADVHIGFGTKVYKDPEGKGKPLVMHHNGAVNALQVSAWVRNNLESPRQVMLNGVSAGGVGTSGLYYVFRQVFNDAQSGYMINDAGPAWFTDLNGSNQDYPSKYLHTAGLDSWGTGVARPLNDGTNRSLLDWYADNNRLGQYGFSKTNLGTINTATAKYMAANYPKDRLGFTTFQEDNLFGSFSYRRAFADAAVQDRDARRNATIRYWQKDVNRFAQTMTGEPNFSYYLPATRKLLDGHVVSANAGKTADIQEQNLTFNDFMQTVTEEQPAMHAQEKDFEADRKQVSVLGSLTTLFLKAAGL